MRALPSVSVLAFLLYIAAVVALHILPCGRDPLRHALSHYVSGRCRGVAHVAGTANVVGVTLLGLALFTSVGSPPLSPDGLGALIIMVLTRIGTRAFPLTAPGEALSWRDRGSTSGWAL